MLYFGNAVDHLVNNAGVTSVALLEEVDDVTDFRAIMVCDLHDSFPPSVI